MLPFLEIIKRAVLLAILTWALPGLVCHNFTLAKAPAQTAIQVHDKWAALVGINQFQDPAIAPVRYAGKNANDLARVLKDPAIGRFAADHVSVLTGPHATKSGIEETLINGWLVKKALPNDLAVVYFSTRVLPSGHDIVLCAYDTLASEADKSGISLTGLLSDLKMRTQSHRLLCVLDTSPIDQLPAEADLHEIVREISRSTGVSLLCANELLGPSYESNSNSYFIEYLVEGLKAGAGLLPLSAVAQYVGRNVHEQVEKTAGKVQSPSLITAADCEEMAQIPLGIAVRSSLPPPKVLIGHPVGQLPLTRPDLAQKQSRRHLESADDEDEDSTAEDVDFSSYMIEMKQAIQKKWIPPKGIENRTVVTVFSILRDGTVVRDSIVESSGVESIDQAALQALHAASPLPPLPLGAPKSVQVRYKFDWRVSRGNMSSTAPH